MECKFFFILEIAAGVVPELIDTLWNVNAVTEAMPDISVIELIDTLWNVNKYVQMES